jgi:DNA modification methylase
VSRMAQHRIFSGHCLHVLRSLRDESFHSIVTDPPYELGFMGKDWDNAQIAFNPRVWQHCYRVLKPGGYLLAFGGTRTFHRIAVAIEDAGFEIRDSIAWIYSTGFPKSLDVSKAIDKANGRVGERVLQLKRELRKAVDASGLRHAEIDVRCGFRATNYLTMPAEGKRFDPWVNILPTADKWAVMADVLGCHNLDGLFDSAEREITQHATRDAVPGDTITFDQRSSTERERRDIPATDAAKKWQGWGTALKPAFEPIIVARKPFKGTVAANVLEHGTGAINIDATRVATNDKLGGGANKEMTRDTRHEGFARPWMDNDETRYAAAARSRENTARAEQLGRWPTNVVLDGEMATELDAQSGITKSSDNPRRNTAEAHNKTASMGKSSGDWTSTGHADSGGASRFFPVIHGEDDDESLLDSVVFKYQAKAPTRERPKVDGVSHPTVKPLELMRWLTKLVTPPRGRILDPFAGSGTTVEAAILEGFRPTAIELCDGANGKPDYVAMIEKRAARAYRKVADGSAEK